MPSPSPRRFSFLVLSKIAATAILLIGTSACRSSYYTQLRERLMKPAEVAIERVHGHDWQLIVDGEPFFIQGIHYRVTDVGDSPDPAYPWTHWSYSDKDGNNRIDGPYDAWVDVDADNRKDIDEVSLGDFELMNNMGANTMVWYHNAQPGLKQNKDLLRDVYLTYGIRVAVGDLLGSGVDQHGPEWEPWTDYRDPAQRQRMMRSVERMVREHKDEPYTLMWFLGAGNNWSFSGTNAWKHPVDYAQFINQVAKRIHEIDGNHPVVLVNEGSGFLDYYAQLAPEVDIFGVNSYLGSGTFEGLWDAVAIAYDRPVLITGFGGYAANGVDERQQALRHRRYWKDIEANRAGMTGRGNAIGGIVEEWLDQWWRAGHPGHHAAPGSLGYYGKKSVTWEHEYTGICSQGDGRHSPFLRQLRQVYDVYRKELWIGKEENVR